MKKKFIALSIILTLIFPIVISSNYFHSDNNYIDLLYSLPPLEDISTTK